VQFDGITFLFCSGFCVDKAQRNWQEKEEKGISPSRPIEIPREKEEDNITDYS